MIKYANDTILKNKILFEKLSAFFYGAYYPVYVALFTAFFYASGLPLLGLAFFTMLSIVTLLCFRDLFPFMPLPMMILMSFRNLTFFSNPLALVLISLIIISIVTHFIIYPIQKFIFGKLFLPICIVSVALLAGGIFSPYIDEYARGLPESLSVGPAVLFVYVFFTNYNCPPDHCDYKERLLYVFLIVGALLSVEMLIHEYYNQIGLLNKFDMGYGNINITATTLLMLIPPCWYFICSKKKFIPYAVILVLLYLAIFLSHSDGVLAVAGAFIPVLAVLGYKNTDQYHKRIFLKIALILCLVAVLGLTVFALKFDVVAILNKFIDKVSTDNNRSPLYLRSLSLFSEHPFFGVGLGYMDASLINPAEEETFIAYVFSFHSTFFHVIGTMGIFGFIAYVIYYVARYKILLRKNTMFNLTAFLSFTLYQIYSMISHEEFQIMPVLLFATLLLITTEKSNNKPTEEPLPLLKRELLFNDLG